VRKAVVAAARMAIDGVTAHALADGDSLIARPSISR
jgi:hypothetical protein